VTGAVGATSSSVLTSTTSDIQLFGFVLESFKILIECQK
jgi:hypothetical protein